MSPEALLLTVGGLAVLVLMWTTAKLASGWDPQAARNAQVLREARRKRPATPGRWN